MHDALLSGHLGRRTTREKVLQHYHWYGARSDVDLFGCPDVMLASQLNLQDDLPKHTKGKNACGMPVGSVMDRLGTDILGPLPETPRGNTYILAVTDYFSKWVEMFVTCADKTLNEVVSRFGAPLSIHSDQGRN